MKRSLKVFGLILMLLSPGCGEDTPASGSGGSAGTAGSGGAGGAAGGTGGSAGVAGGEAMPGDVQDFAALTSGSEGIAFGPGPDGEPVLYVSLNGADQVVTVSPSGQVSAFVSLPSPLGIAVTAAGDLLVCGKAEGSVDEGVVWRVTPQGDASVFIRGDMEPFETPNFIAIAPDDKLVFSDSSAERVYLADAAGENLAILASEISYPNGLAFSQDGTQLFVASWNTTTLWSIPRSPAVGNFGPAATYLEDVASVDGLLVMEASDLVLVSSSEGVVRASPSSKQVVAPSGSFNLAANGAFGVGAYDPNWLYVTNLLGMRVSRVRFDDTGVSLPVR